MFTGTVVENFSYVFQLAGKPLLTRQQMRDYKAAWAEFDVDRSGYLRKDQIVPFLTRLTGAFEVRIHPDNSALRVLLAAASPRSTDMLAAKRSLTMDNFNVAALNDALGKMDVAEIRRRRHRLNRLYHEAMLADDKDRGVSFTKLLLIISSYKLINEVQALEVKDLVERREVLEQVEDRIATERVRNVLKLVYLRRRFLSHQAQRHGFTQPEMPLPSSTGHQQWAASSATSKPNLKVATREIMRSTSPISFRSQLSDAEGGNAGDGADPRQQGDSYLTTPEQSAWSDLGRRVSNTTATHGSQQDEDREDPELARLSAQLPSNAYRRAPLEEDE